MNAVDVVVMAAGKGTRMKSRTAKVLHRLGGRPLIQHVMDTARALHARRTIVITGHGAEELESWLRQAAADQGAAAPDFVRQEPQLGTGHAVQQVVPVLPDDGIALILNGDVPLIRPETLQALVEKCGGERLALLTVEMAEPAGYGRIVRRGSEATTVYDHTDSEIFLGPARTSGELRDR